jgi:hypothetical protein
MVDTLRVNREFASSWVRTPPAGWVGRHEIGEVWPRPARPMSDTRSGH